MHVVVCSGKGVQVFGPWEDDYQAPHNWLASFHCTERRMQDGRLAKPEDWQCEFGWTLADHNIITVQAPIGHRAIESDALQSDNYTPKLRGWKNT